MESMIRKDVDWEYIDINPMDKLKMPKPKKVEADWFNSEELKMLLQKLDEYVETEFKRLDIEEHIGQKNFYTIAKERVDIYKYKVIINLAVVTGARRGEILALTRKDISLEKSSVRISKAVLYTPKKKIYLSETTKTGEERTVGINEQVKNMLEIYYKLLDDMMDCSDDRIPKTDLLFMSLRNTNNATVGGLLYPDPISAWFLSFLYKNGMRRIAFHKLRHSAASFMLENNISVYEVSKIIGDSVQTLLNTYAHSDIDVLISKATVCNKLYENN